MCFFVIIVQCMWPQTFLSNWSPEDAWVEVEKAGRLVGFVRLRAADRLGVSNLTLMRWFKRHPKFDAKWKKLQHDHLKPQARKETR